MKKKIVILPGDGIGKEVTACGKKVLEQIADCFGHQFVFDYATIGHEAIEATGTPLPDESLQKMKNADAVLFGAVGHPKYDNDPSAKVRPEQGLLKMRKELGLYANLRPINTYPALQHLAPLKAEKLQGVDFIIFRELTGGIYFGKKELSEDGTRASDDCVYTIPEIERIAHLAFQYAQKPERKKKLTLVDKANVLETSRLWRKVVQEVSKQYPDVAVDYMFVDNAAMQIILNPKQFDIVLTENMFGDIISDEASVLSGSLGLLPSGSVGTGTVMFEPIHGSYPQAAGKDIANPLGSILSTAMMLEHFGLAKEAALVREAVKWTLENGIVSKDIEPVNFYFTSTIGDWISDYVKSTEHERINLENVQLRKSTII